MSRITPAHSVEIDGRQYEIAVNLSAGKDFEDATGKGILEFFAPIYAAIGDVDLPEMIGKLAALEADPSEEAIAEFMGPIAGLLKSNAITIGDLQALFWAAIGGNYNEESIGRALRLGMISDQRAEWIRNGDAVFTVEQERELRQIGLRNAGKIVHPGNIAEIAGKLYDACKRYAVPANPEPSTEAALETDSPN